MSEATETEELFNESQGRRMDAELRVIGAILRLLTEIDEPARARVVTYLTSRYDDERLRE